jgi:hypothetical protein
MVFIPDAIRRWLRVERSPASCIASSSMLRDLALPILAMSVNDSPPMRRPSNTDAMKAKKFPRAANMIDTPLGGVVATTPWNRGGGLGFVVAAVKNSIRLYFIKYEKTCELFPDNN